MTAFLQDYQTNLDSYAEAVSQSDDAKKAEFGAKLEASIAEWTNFRNELSGNMTPQTVEKFEREFQAGKKKYEKLNGNS